jgi:hypothetical protein
MNDAMKKSLQPYSSRFWVGLAGFSTGGIIGALVTFFIFNSGLLSIVVEMVSPGQPYLRLLFGILLAFVGIGFGGAITTVS